MRPVERREWPVDPATSLPVQFGEWGDARQELARRLGLYCSYCEMPIQNMPAVEHVQPKSRRPELELCWCNFLLACGYCNANKLDKEVNLSDHVWPDQDNTFRAIAYEKPWAVAAAPGLRPAQVDRARRTIALVGLDRFEGGPREPTRNDNRWMLRKQAWEKAEIARRTLRTADTSHVRELVVLTATSTGFWSIWMTVFAEDADMRRRLIEAFPGTSAACFDGACQPVARPGGVV